MKLHFSDRAQNRTVQPEIGSTSCARSNNLQLVTSIEPDVGKSDLSPTREDHSLSWRCAFGSCLKLRIYEGGRPDIAKHCDWCAICQSLVVTDRDDQESIAKLIDQNLL